MKLRTIIFLAFLVASLSATASAQCGKLVPNPATGQMDCVGAGSNAAVSGVVAASQMAGSDCGAKINTANTQLGATAGEIWVDQSCGTTWTTAVTLSANHILRFTQGGIYVLSNAITLAGGGGGIEGSGSGSVWETGTAATILSEANGANLVSLVHITGANSAVTDIELFGNNSNNSSASDVVWIDAARNAQIRRCWISSGKRYGVYAKSSATLANDAAIPRLEGTIISGNGSDGAHFEDLTDGYITGPNEFELNSGYGINLLNSPGTRILDSDLAQNTLGDLILQGTSSHLGSSETLIIGNQFGNGFKQAIIIQGWNGSSYASVNNTITGNHFFSSSNLPDATYPAILINDSFLNSVTGNTFNSSGSNRWTSAISQTTTGHSSIDSYVGNTFNGSYSGNDIAALTAVYCVNTTGECKVVHLLGTGSAPSVASGFGTSPSVTGTDLDFVVNVGTGGTATSGVLNLANTYTSAPICLAQDASTNIATRASAASTTQLTLTAASAWTASDKVNVHCVGN